MSARDGAKPGHEAEKGWTVPLEDAAATRRLGAVLARQLPAGSVVLLSGELGAGKTTLVQGVGAELGIAEAIVSPTFTLICEYLEGRMPLYHLDLYRLEPGAVAQLQLETYWEGWEVEPGLVLIEWAERLPYLPQRYLKISLSYEAEGRMAEVIAVGEWPGLKFEVGLGE